MSPLRLRAGSDVHQADAFNHILLAATLQDQVRACSDHPAYPTPRDAHVPSVDRAEYEKGTRIELKKDNCSVWFSRQKDGRYRVSDRECVGDL